MITNNNITEHKVLKYTKVFIITYFVILGLYSFTTPTTPFGEWDDYTMPAISILNEFNFTISASDIEEYRKTFPEWSRYVNSSKLSGTKIDDGSELTWYFPTYAIASIPFIKTLQWLGIPTKYSFTLLNIFVFILFIVITYRYLQISPLKKLMLILLLLLNPIIFYVTWTSAEVVLYSLLGISCVFWLEKRLKTAALCLSIAGTMNPTVMVFGFFMIGDFFVGIYKNRGNDGLVRCFIKNTKNIIAYGLCYIISLVPFAYNYYYIGHINIVASSPWFTQGAESAFSRFIAYLFDFNFGILPYFHIVFLLSIILLFIAIFRKQWVYIAIILSFLGTVYSYSIMKHINCGMSGIARYNAWSIVFIIFAVVIYYDKIIQSKRFKIFFAGLLIFSSLITASIVYIYGPVRSLNTHYVHMQPIGKFVLDYVPVIYDPLKSTFNSRVNHKDGGYSYKTPIVYTNDKGEVRKILASEKDKEHLLKMYFTIDGSKCFEKRISQLNNEDKYISISPFCKVVRYDEYTLGDKIIFYGENYNADKYVVSGLSHKEEHGSWTESKKLRMHLKIKDSIEKLYFKANINRVYAVQSIVNAYVNGQYIDNVRIDGKVIDFAFAKPDTENIEIVLEFPNAIAPKDISPSYDKRQLAVHIKDIFIDDNL